MPIVADWRERRRRRRNQLLSAVLLLVAAGLAMLFLPGQGLLTVLIGVCVMDFPGKRGLLQRLVRGPKVQGALNWIRRKRGKEPFAF